MTANYFLRVDRWLPAAYIDFACDGGGDKGGAAFLKEADDILRFINKSIILF